MPNKLSQCSLSEARDFLLPALRGWLPTAKIVTPNLIDADLSINEANDSLEINVVYTLASKSEIESESPEIRIRLMRSVGNFSGGTKHNYVVASQTEEEAINRIRRIISGCLIECEHGHQLVGDTNAEMIIRAITSFGWSWVKV